MPLASWKLLNKLKPFEGNSKNLIFQVSLGYIQVSQSYFFLSTRLLLKNPFQELNKIVIYLLYFYYHYPLYYAFVYLKFT